MTNEKKEKKQKKLTKRVVLTIIAIILLAFAAFELIFWLITGQNAVKNTIDYVGDKTGMAEPNKETEAVVDGYTSFESVPETVTWTANTTDEPLTLKNMTDNTVDLAPKVYVDVNGDGTFTDDECLYNADGAKRIAPGNSIDTITLSKPLAAGNYIAQVSYSAYATGTNSEANGMIFNFNVVVQ